jgi:hypothetical protein
MRFQNYLVEGITVPINLIQVDKMIHDSFACIDKFNLSNEDIVWRGFKSKGLNYILQIVNDRKSYYGAIKPKVEKFLKNLNLPTQPIFTTKDKSGAGFFGSPMIFIPNSDFVVYYNEDIQDIQDVVDKTQEEMDQLVDKYILSINKFPGINKHHELIITCQDYYLFHPRFDKKSNLQKYKDLLPLYERFVLDIKKRIKNNLKFNKNLLNYYKETYPQEWLEN